MYLIWKKRKVRTSRPSEGCLHQEPAGRLSLVPVLVRNRRVKGRPRQEHVAALPSIRTCCLGDPLIRARWWNEVLARLERLENTERGTDGAERQGQDWRLKVRASLESKVAYPSAEEWGAFKAAERAREKQIAREALDAAEKVRREEQRQQELRRKAEEEARLLQASRQQAVMERNRTAMAQPTLPDDFTEKMNALIQLGREAREEPAPVQEEPAPSEPETEGRGRGARKQEVRKTRRVRI